MMKNIRKLTLVRIIGFFLMGFVMFDCVFALAPQSQYQLYSEKDLPQSRIQKIWFEVLDLFLFKDDWEDESGPVSLLRKSLEEEFKYFLIYDELTDEQLKKIMISRLSSNTAITWIAWEIQNLPFLNELTRVARTYQIQPTTETNTNPWSFSPEEFRVIQNGLISILKEQQKRKEKHILYFNFYGLGYETNEIIQVLNILTQVLSSLKLQDEVVVHIVGFDWLVEVLNRAQSALEYYMNVTQKSWMYPKIKLIIKSQFYWTDLRDETLRNIVFLKSSNLKILRQTHFLKWLQQDEGLSASDADKMMQAFPQNVLRPGIVIVHETMVGRVFKFQREYSLESVIERAA